MTGASSYTIGSGGDLNTAWPVEIKGAVVDTDYNCKIIGEARYRALNMSSGGGSANNLWYNPVYPLGVLYPWPTGGSSMVIDSLKALLEPVTITTEIEFPPSYDAAIRWNLIIWLSIEFGKAISPLTLKLAEDSKDVIKSKNMANQINAVDLSHIGRSGGHYDINGDM